MKVRVTFDISRETREAIAFEIDGKLGRLATRDEIIGKICDGAEMSLVNAGGAGYDAEVQARDEMEKLCTYHATQTTNGR